MKLYEFRKSRPKCGEADHIKKYYVEWEGIDEHLECSCNVCNFVWHMKTMDNSPSFYVAPVI